MKEAVERNTAAPTRALGAYSFLRIGWILFGGIEILCLFLGTVNLVVAHMDAAHLARFGSPGDDMSGAARGFNDWLIVLVAVFTVCLFIAATVRLTAGHGNRKLLAFAFLGACLVCFDAYLVGGSGWLADCVSCGGKPEQAQTEAMRALAFTGTAVVVALVGLIWLSIRDDFARY